MAPPRRSSGSSSRPTRSGPPTTEQAPGADGTSSDGTSSVEVELKFDVEADTPLPDWSALPGVAEVGAAEVRELDARYFDTPDLTLGHAGFALRRRTGGPDEGWHVKGPRVGDARVELHWPLGDGLTGDPAIPAAVRAGVAAVADGPFALVARIQNHRTAYALRDAAGGLVAEFVDDHVVATDERTQAERRWREWEFELGPAAPAVAELRAALFAAAEAAVRAAGGRVAASDSKLARALGA